MHGLSARSAIESRFLDVHSAREGPAQAPAKSQSGLRDTVPARARMRGTRSGRVGSRGLSQNLA
jgi:hypothetical protein